MIVHWPDASVTVVVQVPPVIEPSAALGRGSHRHAGSRRPAGPVVLRTVTVNVCASPTLFVPDCAIEMRASTQVLVLETVKAP